MKPLFIILLLICSSLCFGQIAMIPKTKKVSLIFVGAQTGLSESSFGHVALRLSPKMEPGLLDIVVEFVAEIPEGEAPIKKYLKGAGLFKRYPVLADTKSFYDYRKQKTINENRDLTVYELDLSPEEVRSVVDFIQNFQEDDTPAKYNFLSKNCSFFAALALEKAIEKRLKSKSKPWKVSKVLKKHGIVISEFLYPRATAERRRYAQKFVEENSDLLPQSWAQSFVQNMGEKIYVFRQSSYLKLLWVYNRGNEDNQKKVQALLRYLLPHETEVAQFTIKNLFRNPQHKTVIPLKILELGEVAGNLPKKKKTIKHELVVQKNVPYLKVKWRGKYEDSKQQGMAKALIPLKGVNYESETQKILFDQQNVGRNLDLKADEWVLSQKLDYGLDTNEEGRFLRSFLYVDSSPEVAVPKLTLEELKTSGHLAINNVLDFKGEIGSCYSMALLQKAFFERAIFLPEVKEQAESDKLGILSALVSGKYVVIPGYSNITEFTKAIPKEKLKAFLVNYQKSLSKGAISQLLENAREREVLNAKSLPNLKALLDEGMTVPLIIGMTEKGKNKLASQTAHVILLHAMEPLAEGGYRLTAYDPNAGINSLFTMDENLNLHYPFYDKKYDYKGMLDGISSHGVSLDQAVRSRAVDVARLKFELKSGIPLILDSLEVARILK